MKASVFLCLSIFLDKKNKKKKYWKVWSIYVKIESLNGLTLNIIANEQPLEDARLRGGSL